MKRTFYFSSLILTFIVSCNRQSVDFKELKLNKDTIITQLNDSTFFSDIRSMFFDKYLYVSDYKRNQIIVLDTKAHVIKTIGMPGRGPGEFQGISHIVVDNDTIYAQNDGKRCIEILDIDGFIKTVPLKRGIQLQTTSRFSYLNNTFYLSSVTKENSIVAYDFVSDSIKHLGIINQFANEEYNYYRNERHIFIVEGRYIIAVSHTNPVIEKYDINGNLLEQFSYKDILPVQKRIKFIENQQSEINSVYELISDAYIESDKIYLILISNEGNAVSSNRILKIDFRDKMKAAQLYNLDEGWFSSICITKEHLWAFDGKGGSLVMFSLK
jgi:hypothetical protein